MDKYEVMLYPRAFRDIEDIYKYIALVKMAPEYAKGQTDRSRNGAVLWAEFLISYIMPVS